jgi:hypothetical protein
MGSGVFALCVGLSMGCSADSERSADGGRSPRDDGAASPAEDGGGMTTPGGDASGFVDGSASGGVGAQTDRVDLLVVVDNSGSMIEVQRSLMVKFEVLLQTLVAPLCGSRANPSAPPHGCDASNADDVALGRPLRDLQVGVVSTDLGTPGSMVPGCDASERGDHGLLNPIRNGYAMETHLPWAPSRPNAMRAPPGFRPSVCENDAEQFPSFITFCSDLADPSCDRAERNASTRDRTTFASWFRCNAGLFINGCGLESPLESAWRALHVHGARRAAGDPAPNAGFLRDDALLAIVVISDEEDGSIRNCQYDQGFSAQSGTLCSDARDVYDPVSRAWAHPTNPDLRFYLYDPGAPNDPTWNLDRYANTAPSTVAHRWQRDFWSLKPGRPERVVFAAITGVPLAVPARADGATDYDALLGAAHNGAADDFVHRDSARAITGTQGAAGPFSMRHANMEPGCGYVVPACRQEGSTFDPARACGAQGMAAPSRRIVEVARRFEEHPACDGRPCRNGYVSSICARSLEDSLREIGLKISRRMRGG